MSKPTRDTLQLFFFAPLYLLAGLGVGGAVAYFAMNVVVWAVWRMFL
jgi:hypothetical protein